MSSSQRSLILASVFFLSGLAALIYQVSWQRLLSVHYGVGAISTAIIVSIFMLGLGVGALIGGYLSEKVRDPVFAYVLVEAGIGLFGATSLPFLSFIGSHTAGSDYWLMLLCVSGFLLLPTVLMGITLPVVLRILYDIHSDNLGNISFYYCVNTLGAAFGALFGSYVLISMIGIDRAVYTAVIINSALALTVWLVRRLRVTTEPSRPPRIAPKPEGTHAATVLILLFVNGFFAIGYQMIWYRIVGVLLKDSSYSFATILGVYLLGIGLGSLWLNQRKSRQPVRDIFSEYLRLNALTGTTAAAAVLLVYYCADAWPFTELMRYGNNFPILPVPDSVFLRTLGLVFLWPLILVLVPAFFMGAAFPVGLSLSSSSTGSRGSSIGIAYAVTIAGNTLGGLVSSFFLLPQLGTSNVLAGFATVQLSFLILVAAKGATRRVDAKATPWLALAGLSAIIFLSPASEMLYRRLHPKQPGFAIHYREGVEGIVMAFERPGVLRNYINGSAHGGRPGGVFVNEAFVALSHSPTPRDVLVIGFGTGALLDALLLDERISSVTLVELNRTALDNLRDIPFASAGLNDPRVRVVFDDGRRYLERNNQAFDLVVMDPLRSRSAFSNNIYSAEFFQLVDRHLSPDGVVLVWTDDASHRLDKGLALTFPYVNRYQYFLVATRRNTEPSGQQYLTLLAKLAPQDVPDIQRLRTLPLRQRDDILRQTSCLAAPRDARPYLEYYLGDYFLNSRDDCLISNKEG